MCTFFQSSRGFLPGAPISSHISEKSIGRLMVHSNLTPLYGLEVESGENVGRILKMGLMQDESKWMVDN